MTESPRAAREVAEPIKDTVHELTLEQLASVRDLLDPARATTFHDILITTALEALASGPLTEAELVAHASRMWPGTGVDAVRINAALRVAQGADYVAQLREQGPGKWTLTKLGLSEVRAARDWAGEILEDTARQVQESLASAARNVTIEEARLWTGVLRQALMAGIAGAFAPYVGDVQAKGRVVTVRRWDGDAIRRIIDETNSDERDRELLSALAIDALDPLTPFGNELVSAITVGYMLHAFVGRRDRVASRAVVGSLNGVRAILDTPVLLRLLGPPEIASPIKRVVTGAIASGMQVVVLEHYLDELHELLGSVEAANLEAIEQVIAEGVDAAAIGALLENDVLSLWTRAVASGRYRKWSEFRAAAESLRGDLGSIGVVVRPHYNREEDNVKRFQGALAEELTSTGSGRRGVAIERDAHAMAVAHRKRQRTERAFWPGAWIITSDRHIGPAYARLFPGDAFGLTLTPAAWVAIVSNCSPPAEVESLATAASQLFGEEGFVSIAARFPVQTAIDLARALGTSSGGSSLDVRVAQSIDEVLRNQPDYDDERVGARLAAEVVARRSERMNQTYAANAELAQERADRMAAALRESQRRAEERGAELDRMSASLSEARDEVLSAHTVVAEVKMLERRRTIAIVVAAMFLIVVVWLWWVSLTLAALVALIALAVWGYQSSEWVARPDLDWRRMLLAVAIGVGAFVIGWLQR